MDDCEIGTAIVTMIGSTRIVERADPMILVDESVLQPGALDPGMWEPDDTGGVLTLDSAGEYRYRYVRRSRCDHGGPAALVFERIGDG